MFAKYAKDLNIKSEYIVSKDLFEEFNKLNNIEHLTKWLLNLVKSCYDYIEAKNKNRNAEVVNNIKEYCNNNLGDDLSLEILSKKAYLSPKYLSKLFEDETGRNLTEFIQYLRCCNIIHQDIYLLP